MANSSSKASIDSLVQSTRVIPFCRLPFTGDDATAGSEDELQAVVLGPSQSCDLPLTIQESRFLRNIARRRATGEAPTRTMLDIEAFLSDTTGVWENSWIRFQERRLSQHARQVFEADLQVERNGAIGERSDASRFRILQNGESWLRIPISYALKLALADLIGTQPHLPAVMREEAGRLMRHLLNDNTSPETTSFHIVESDCQHSLGERVAREAARRFLFTTLLVGWANLRFGLSESAQRAMVYHAPVPSMHQEDLAASISDSFYRELFMSPCLSGWSNGEEKHQYMHLCHQVLSRSQLNALGKLREAGIISNDLVVLPKLSNISLANNGIHVSIGSRVLDQRSLMDHAWQAGNEKRIGDLAIKIYEHFLVLFVGIYTAAPYRIGFSQFHPECLLSFLPHELDFTHLRLLWREWKEKADLNVFGRPLTPYGPRRVDDVIASLFRLRGDCVPDARLLTYPVAWLATEHSSALNGVKDNVDHLSSELDELGIVDRRMSFYMPLRLREQERHGYSGFEARYYSLFPSYDRDMAAAVNLQQFLLAVSYRLAVAGYVKHEDIADDPTSESERRQPFFFPAVGVPAFYVHRTSKNVFLRQLLQGCKKVRSSRRHPKYLRVSVADYRRSLLLYLRETAGDLVEEMGMDEILTELTGRCNDSAQEAGQRLISAIVGGGEEKAMRLEAREFNRAAESFYRESLRRQHLQEAWSHLRQDVEAIPDCDCEEMRVATRHGIRVQNLNRFLDQTGERALNEELALEEVATLLNLLILLTYRDAHRGKGGHSCL